MDRKIFLSLLFAAGSVLSASAQDAVSLIRKHYAEAQQKVAEYTKNEQEGEMPFPQYYELKISQNLPGSGPHVERVKLYFYEHDLADEYEPGGALLSRSVHFVTTKYNYAAREFYEEYLYDEQGNIEFAYLRNADMNEFTGGELRLYFKQAKLIKVLVNLRDPQTEKYNQTYSGATLPSQYQSTYDLCMLHVDRFKSLFAEIDRSTFH